jgi:hypothetical protein
MQPLRWHPPVAFSIQEEQIVQRIRKAKLFVFLRQHRHILSGFQAKECSTDLE